MNDTTESDLAASEAAIPARRQNRELLHAESQQSEPRLVASLTRTSEIGWRALVAVLCDLVIAGGGASILWFGGNATIADAHVLNYVVFVLTITVMLVFRHLAIGRRGLMAASLAEVRIDRVVTLADLALLSAIGGAWFVTGDYFLGWIAVFSALMLLLGTALQLMLDLLSGRNSQAQERGDAGIGSRVLTLEVCRIVLGVVTLTVIIVGAEIHGWNPAILNLTVLLAAVSMGLSTLVATARNRR